MNHFRAPSYCRKLSAYEWLVITLLLPAVLTVTPLRFGLLLIIPLLWLIRRIGYGNFIVSTPYDGSNIFTIASHLQKWHLTIIIGSIQQIMFSE